MRDLRGRVDALGLAASPDALVVESPLDDWSPLRLGPVPFGKGRAMPHPRGPSRVVALKRTTPRHPEQSLPSRSVRRDPRKEARHDTSRHTVIEPYVQPEANGAIPSMNDDLHASHRNEALCIG